MQAFTHYQPTAFGQSPHSLVRCAALTCEKIIPFGKMVVWGWQQSNQNQFRAFCSNCCALGALPHENFNQG